MKKLLLCLALGTLGMLWSPSHALTADTPAPTLAACDRVRILAAPKHEKEIVGVKISGSNTSDKTDLVLLAQVTQAPEPGQWLELTIKNPKPYRWLRYDAPEGTPGWISRLEFYAGPQKLTGDYFSVWPQKWRNIFSATPKQDSVAGDKTSGQYFGLDIGERASCPKPRIRPGGNDLTAPVNVTLETTLPGASIRYTMDGTLPTATNGAVYTKPFPIDHAGVVTAVTFAEGVAPSPAADTIYTFKSNTPTRISFNLGNSLTGNAVSRFDAYARTAGYAHECKSFLMGGGIPRTLWNTAMLDKADPNDKVKWKDLYTTTKSMGGVATYDDAAVTGAKATWSRLWPSLTRLDDMTFQPRGSDVAEEVDYILQWLAFVREKFPVVRPWVYVEWDEAKRDRATDKALVPSYQMKKLYPALTWEESMSAMMLYGEEVESQMSLRYSMGRKPRIIPVALAMGWIHHMIKSGQVPGVAPTGYFSFMHSDAVHANVEGSYLVDAVWFAAMYGQSPEGKFLPWKTSLTPEQAQIMQRLAWDVVKNYPDCEYYDNGTTPVAKAEFSLPPGALHANERLSLTSATPGAWFRYTLDGTEPTRTCGYIYCGVITVRPGMTVKAIAYKSGMTDSSVTSASY